jgi:hypothetical protein
MPRRDQRRVVLVDLGLEAPERATALQSDLEMLAGHLVADAGSEVHHVLIPDVLRQRVDRNQIEFVDHHGVVAIDPRIAGPERHLSRARQINQRCS